MKNFLALILALIMIFSVSVAAFATDNYSEYFSVEREFDVVDNALDYSTYLYSNEETGYLYSRNVDTKEERLIYDKNVTNHYVWDGNIYCIVDGNSIVKIAVDGSDPETILTTEKDIDRLYVNDELIFYQMDNSIYRYYIESGITDCIVEADYIYFFYPYSNFVVEWGVGDNIVYRVDTSAVNSVDGTGTTNTTTLDEYTFIEEIHANAVSSSSTYVNGQTIPLTDYPNGSYYTKTGEKCKQEANGGCHRSGGVCKYDIGACPNCKSYNGAAQCMGFAHYVYKQIWGVDTNKNEKHNRNTGTGSAAAAREFLWGISSGTELRVTGPHTTGHSIIVANITDSGVYIYHANGDGTCKVEYEYFTFSNFASEYSYIQYSYDARHIFNNNYVINNAIHWKECSHGNCNGIGSKAYHSYRLNNHGISVCVECNHPDPSFTSGVVTETQ